MNRENGLFSISGNFEPNMSAPLDARARVALKEYLFLPSTWTSSDLTTYTYLGMIVSVYGDIATNNGIYQLVNEDFTLNSSWVKPSSSVTDLSDYVKYAGKKSGSVSGISIGDSAYGGTVVEVVDKGDGVLRVNIANFAAEVQKPWGPSNTGIIELPSDGSIATQMIIDLYGNGDYAAKYCSDLVLNGYSDWYLGSEECIAAFKYIMGDPPTTKTYWLSSNSFFTTETSASYVGYIYGGVATQSGSRTSIRYVVPMRSEIIDTISADTTSIDELSVFTDSTGKNIAGAGIKKSDLVLSVNGTKPDADGNVVVAGGSGSGDMLKSTYDTNNNGKVDGADDSSMLGGNLPAYYASANDLSTGLSNKVDKETGKGLSTNDYTTAEKTKLSNQSGTNTGDETSSTILTKIGDGSKISETYLPSYVDDVIEGTYIDATTFKVSGSTITQETGKIYISTDSNVTYRWSGSAYVAIGSSLALGETDSTAYRGDRGKIAYEHSQSTGNPHSTTAAQITQDSSNRFVSDIEKNTWNSKEPAITAGTESQYYRGDKTFQTLDKTAVGLNNVDNTSDANKPVSTAQATAIGLKQDALVSGTNIKTVNGTSVLGSGDIIISGGGAGSDTTAIHTTTSGEISTLTEKTTLVDNDILLSENSENSFSKVKTKLSSLKTYLTTAFNKVYSLITDTGDRHGFAYPTLSSLSFNNSTRVLTISANTGYDIYVNGTKYTITTDKTVSITNTKGQWFIYYTIVSGIPTLNASQTPWNILDLTVIPVSLINWNGVSGRLCDERHSSKRNLVWHDSEHSSIGARYRSGFTSLTCNANNTFSLSSGIINDEDIILDAGGTQTTCQLAYRDAGAATMTWDTSSTAYVKLSANNRPVYDNAGVITEITNNNYAVYFLTMTNCITSGQKIISVLGQGNYSTVSLAQAANYPSIPGLGVAEWKYLYRIIVKRSGDGFTFIQSDPLYNLQYGAAVNAGAFSSITASGVSVVAQNGITSTNVQDAIVEVYGNIKFKTATITSANGGSPTRTNQTFTLAKQTLTTISNSPEWTNITIALADPADGELVQSVLFFSVTSAGEVGFVHPTGTIVFGSFILQSGLTYKLIYDRKKVGASFVTTLNFDKV